MNPRHVLVVGGSRGLGKVFVEVAHGDGYAVSALSRSSPGCYESGWYDCDVTRADLVGPALHRIEADRGRLNGIVFFQRHRANGDDWDGEIQTSLTATKQIIEQAVPSLERGASIVLVSSVNSRWISLKLPCSYHVAKAGLCQMAQYFACKLGELGVRVNAVCPGTFIKPENEAFYLARPELVERLSAASPLKRLGTCSEVARAILFLLGDDSSFITGHSLLVDGGVSLRWQETLLE